MQDINTGNKNYSQFDNINLDTYFEDINTMISEIKKDAMINKKRINFRIKPDRKSMFTAVLILISLIIFFGFKKISSIRITNLTIDKLWEYKTLASIYSTAVIADINNDKLNDIIITSMDGKLYSFDGLTGKRLFFFETEQPILSSPVILDRSSHEKWIVLTGNEKKIYVLDKNNHCIWATIKQNLDSSIISTPVTFKINNDNIPDIVAAAADGKIYAFDGDRGWLIWKSGETKGNFFSTPLPIKINKDKVSDIIIGSPEKKIYGIDGKTGMKIWEISAAGAVNSSPVFFNSKTVFIGDEAGVLYKINIKTGNIIAQVPFKASIVSTPVLINHGSQSIIAVPLTDGTIMAVNPQNLNIIWAYDTKYQDPFTASPAFFDFNKDGYEDIIITSRNGYLYIINGKSGINIMEPYFTGNSISSSPVLGDINNDGFLDVIFGSENGNVLALTVRTVPDKNIKNNKIVFGTFLNRQNEKF